MREWDANRAGITPGKKRDALDYLFSSAGSNAETLHNRLHSLVRAWSHGSEVEESELVDGEPPPVDIAAVEPSPPTATTTQPASRASELLPELRDLLAFALEHAVAAQIAEAPELAAQAKELATSARKASSTKAVEELLVEHNTIVLKFFLHISKDEQKQRLQERIDDPKKRWKWSSRDLDERRRWDDYQQAYEEALAATSTVTAPWYVIPADRNWFRDLAVSEILVEALEGMQLRMPPGDPGVAGLQVT